MLSTIIRRQDVRDAWMFGYCSMGSSNTEISPNSTMKIEIPIDRIGRSTNIFTFIFFGLIYFKQIYLLIDDSTLTYKTNTFSNDYITDL